MFVRIYNSGNKYCYKRLLKPNTLSARHNSYGPTVVGIHLRYKTYFINGNEYKKIKNEHFQQYARKKT